MSRIHWSAPKNPYICVHKRLQCTKIFGELHDLDLGMRFYNKFVWHKVDFDINLFVRSFVVENMSVDGKIFQQKPLKDRCICNIGPIHFKDTNPSLSLHPMIYIPYFLIHHISHWNWYIPKPKQIEILSKFERNKLNDRSNTGICSTIYMYMQMCMCTKRSINLFVLACVSTWSELNFSSNQGTHPF